MLVGNGGQMIASLGVFLYLARVLSPADFGAMGMAAALVDLLTVFGRFGQVEALLQRGADDQPIRSTSFWLLMLIGIANLLLIAALAEPMAYLTHASAVAPVMLVLAAVPLLQNVGQVNEAIMRHEMRYQGIAVRNVTATVTGAAVAAILAMNGFGVFALAAQKLVFTIVYSLAVVVARPWMPSRCFVRTETRRLLATGFDVTISNTLQMANGRIVDLCIGFFLGVVALGQTRVAWRLYDFSLQLVIAPLSSVSYSLFARVRDQREAMQQAYLQYAEIISLIAAPIFVGVSLLSSDAMVLLAGPKWEGSASVLAMLTLSILASCMSLIFSPVMVAKGRTNIIRRQALLQTVVNALLTVLAAQFSVTAVVVTYVLRMYAFAFLNVQYMNTTLEVSWSAFARRMRPIVLATAGLAASGIAVREAMFASPAIARIIAVSLVGALGYVGVIVAGDKAGIWPGYVAEFLAGARALVRRQRPASVEG